MEAIEILAGIFALGILLKMVSITLYPNTFAKTTEKFNSKILANCNNLDRFSIMDFVRVACAFLKKVLTQLFITSEQ